MIVKTSLNQEPSLDPGKIGLIFSTHNYLLWPLPVSLLRGGRVREFSHGNLRLQNKLDYADTKEIKVSSIKDYLAEDDKSDSLDVGGVGDFVGIYPKVEAMLDVGAKGLPLRPSYGFIVEIDAKKIKLTHQIYQKNWPFPPEAFEYDMKQVQDFYEVHQLVSIKRTDAFLDEMLSK